MSDRLLIIGGGVEACEGIQIAKSMGLALFVVDGDPQAPGFAYADHKIVASTYDPDCIIKKVIEVVEVTLPLNGVIAMCADVPLSVAIVAHTFNLPSLSIETARLVSDKLAMKEHLKHQGIPIPHYSAIDTNENIEMLVQKIGLPMVIKPVDSRGARGVQLVERLSDIENAIIIAKNNSPTGRVMAEEYLSGPQVSTETLIENMKPYTIGFSDRNYSNLENTKPYFIENGGDAPSRLPFREQEEVIKTAERAALALGIKDGVAKGDMVMTTEGAKVIEIAGRLSGGYFSTTQIPLATGVNFVEQAIRICLGKPIDTTHLSRTVKQGVAIRYLPVKSGKILSISGLDKAEKSSGVKLIKVFIKEGDVISHIDNHTKRAGFVICIGPTKEQAIKRANLALSEIKITYV